MTTALVLGGGGLVGAAYEAGVLAAVHEATGWDPRTADIILGTSAGSRQGVLLRFGFGPRDLYALETDHGMSFEGRRLLSRLEPLPTVPTLLNRPKFHLPSKALLAQALRHPVRSRAGLLSAALPTGPFETKPFAETLRRLCGAAWPVEQLWIVAARLPLGERVTFGRKDCPECDVPAAVAASCAVPGVFAPVAIADGMYVDGGVHSPTNADLLLDEGHFDTVVIVSPMSTSREALKRRRLNPVRLVCRALLAAEVRRLRKTGTNVIVFQPGPAEQRVMGLNAIDATRCPAVARTARDSVLARFDSPGTLSTQLAAA
jgi:NTE family protein